MTWGTFKKAQQIIAGAALAVIIFVTLGDVAVKIFTGRPIRGVYDVVQATQVFMIFFALPGVFKAGSNITVDLVDGLVSERVIAFLRLFAGVASIAFLLIILFSSFPVARDAYVFGEYMLDTGIQYWIMWAAVLYGLAMSLVATLLHLLPRIGDDEKGNAEI